MFPRHIKFAALAADAVVLSFLEGVLNVRLITTQVPAFKDKRALPGALIRPHETADQTVVRVLAEKAGIHAGYIEQVYTFSRVDRDRRGRVVSVAYIALLTPAELTKVAERKEHTAVWVPVTSAKRLAYDHDEILAAAVARLQAKLEYTDIIRHLLPKAFTLTELQEAYETILKRKLDKRNFRKKLLAQGVLKKTGKHTSGGSFRPAELYAFVPSKGGVIDLI